jgi:hypothetical protein
MRGNLASDGIVLFDVNTLACYRSFFSNEQVVEFNGRRFVWRGKASAAEVSPGSISEASFVAEDEPDRAHVHRQRHFTEGEVLAALERAGLGIVGVYGELGGELSPGFDESINTKAVYVARGAAS